MTEIFTLERTLLSMGVYYERTACEHGFEITIPLRNDKTREMTDILVFQHEKSPSNREDLMEMVDETWKLTEYVSAEDVVDKLKHLPKDYDYEYVG